MLRLFARRSLSAAAHLGMPATIVEGRPLVPVISRAKLAKQRVMRVPSMPPSLRMSDPELELLRLVPTLLGFYAGNPVHDHNVSELQTLLRKHINLPTRGLLDVELKEHRFLLIEAYRSRIQLGTRLKMIHFRELTSLLHRLRSIDPELMPRDVRETLKTYYAHNQTSAASVAPVKTVKVLDQFGRALGKAKRKEARAHVYVVKGEGQVLVNGELLTTYFPEDMWRRRIAFPFQVLAQEGKYNIFATTHGGGKSGQAEAIMYAVAKAMVVVNPLLKPRLYKAGLMTSDARVVERKKPGKLKARKSPAWVKR